MTFSLDDFDVEYLLGEGTYGSVLKARLVRDAPEMKRRRCARGPVALKQMGKGRLVEHKQVKHACDERRLLATCGEHPNVLRLYRRAAPKSLGRARPRLLRASPRRRRAAAVSPRASFGRYGAFSDPDAVYLVTELIEGPDLWSILYRLAERNSERRDPFGLDFYNVGLRGPPFVRTTQRRTIVVSFR